MLKFSEAVLKVRFHCLHRHVKAQFLSRHQKNPGPVRVHQVSVRELEFVDCFSVPMVRTLLNVPEDSEFLNCSRDFQFPAGSMASALLVPSGDLQLPADSMGYSLLLYSGSLQLLISPRDSEFLNCSGRVYFPADSRVFCPEQHPGFLNHSVNLCTENHPGSLFFSTHPFWDHSFLFVPKILSPATLYYFGSLPVCHKPVPQVWEGSEYFPVLFFSFPQKIFSSTNGFCVLLVSL